MKNLNRPATGEGERLHWERATNDLKDLTDIFGVDPPTGLLKLNPSVSDMISERLMLRRGKTAIGFLAYGNESFKDIGPLLWIDLVYIRPSDRNPVIFKNIVKTVREIAEKRNLKQISWEPRSANIIKISDKIKEPSSTPGELFVISTEDFDIATLLNMQKAWRKKRMEKRIRHDFIEP